MFWMTADKALLSAPSLNLINEFRCLLAKLANIDLKVGWAFWKNDNNFYQFLKEVKWWWSFFVKHPTVILMHGTFQPAGASASSSATTAERWIRVKMWNILCVFRTQVGFATVEDDEFSPAVEIYVWAWWTSLMVNQVLPPPQQQSLRWGRFHSTYFHPTLKLHLVHNFLFTLEYLDNLSESAFWATFVRTNKEFGVT